MLIVKSLDLYETTRKAYQSLIPDPAIEANRDPTSRRLPQGRIQQDQLLGMLSRRQPGPSRSKGFAELFQRA
jgi:hypothetical protein